MYIETSAQFISGAMIGVEFIGSEEVDDPVAASLFRFGVVFDLIIVRFVLMVFDSPPTGYV